MRKILLSLLLIIISIPAWAEENKKESAFERVMRTNTIRCGYYVFPPVTYRDPNTGELSGFTIDMMNEIGKRSGLKIEWTEETNFVNWTESMKVKRFDVACTPNWPDSPLGRVVSFSIPMFYAGIYPMVRSDDIRFQREKLTSKDFNLSQITFATVEGDSIDSIIRTHFPKVKVNTLPKSSGDSSIVLEILTGKADVILTDSNGKIEFDKAHKGKLKFIDSIEPIKLQPFVLAVDRQELILKDFLDNAIHDLINDGTMDRLLSKWEPEPGKTYLRVANPAKVQ